MLEPEAYVDVWPVEGLKARAKRCTEFLWEYRFLPNELRNVIDGRIDASNDPGLIGDEDSEAWPVREAAYRVEACRFFLERAGLITDRESRGLWVNIRAWITGNPSEESSHQKENFSYIVAWETLKLLGSNNVPQYALATQQIFFKLEDAIAFAGTLSGVRRPLIVAGNFGALKIDDGSLRKDS